MYLIGDIGNTEVKICIFDSSKKLQKKITLKTNLITNKYLNNKSEYLGKKIQEFKSGMFSVKKIYRNKMYPK